MIVKVLSIFALYGVIVTSTLAYVDMAEWLIGFFLLLTTIVALVCLMTIDDNKENSNASNSTD